MEIFSIKNLSFKYNKSDSFALRDVNLDIKNEEILLVIGESGCGKTTLLRMLKKELMPFGEMSGEILYNGEDIKNISDRTSASQIGYIFQEPDAQIVTDRVSSELCFGLESLGTDNKTMRAAVSEFVSYFGLSDVFDRKTSELSGGQKQLLNLASVMITRPDVIILDEPTAQLDPISALDFITMLRRINSEFGSTIIIAEHHLSEIYQLADRIVFIEKGQISAVDSPNKIPEKLKGKKIERTLPAPVRVYNAFGFDFDCPLNCRDGKRMIEPYSNSHYISVKELNKDNKIISAKDVWFRYERNSPDILRSCDLCIYKGEFFALLGENGSGKTTLLSILGGFMKPYRGKVRNTSNKTVYLPQNPRALFVKETLREDLNLIDNSFEELSLQFNIFHLLDRHPYDLSGGELQRAALCKLMLTNPDVLLLDEPTKGLDYFAKNEIGNLLQKTLSGGVTIIMVTHDVDFAAGYADRCGLLFDGSVTVENDSNSFFANNKFYTTLASRMSRGVFKNAVTTEEVIECIRAGETDET